MKKLLLALSISMVACARPIEVTFKNVTSTLDLENVRADGITTSSIVNWNVPVAESNDAAVAELINKTIVDSIASMAQDAPNIEATLQEAQKYNTDTINYANNLDWVGFQNPNLVSILMNRYQYRGGAHGGIIPVALTLDSQTGKTVNVLDHITDKETFLKLFVEEYCKEYELNKDSSILKNGYFIELNALYIPSILLLTDVGIQGTYKQYEIACYAVGQTSATVPYDKIKSIFTLDVADMKQIVEVEK